MGLDRLAPVALGGAIGALLRWGIAEGIGDTGFPWHTLLVNIAGCALLALVTAEAVPDRTQRFLATGFCGGLTTFSTFTVEIVRLLDDGQLGTAISYLVLSVVLGLAAFIAARSLRPVVSREIGS